IKARRNPWFPANPLLHSLAVLALPAVGGRSCAAPAMSVAAKNRTSGVRGLLVGRGRAVASLFALAQEAGQLGGGRRARRGGGVVDLVAAALELLDVGGRLFVGRDRLAHLVDVRLGGLVQLRRVDLCPEQVGKAGAENRCRLRARRERDVVRNSCPQAG